ncbi:MAG: response regulator [Rhodospirillales bacterium]|nr:response regulator [Rhodospirillales bacterium]
MADNDTSETRVLVVDDNAMSRAVIERRLSRDGYSVLTASSGIEALSIVSREPVGLIFLDLVMDGMGGMEVLSELKADARYRHIPVVIISGLDDAGAADDCKAAGASEFLHKPVMAATLQETVIDLLGAAPSDSVAATAVTRAGTSVEDSATFDPIFIGQLISDYGKETTAGFIAQFEELAPAQKDAIAAARDKNSAKAWSRAAHDLKGGARTLGLPRLAAICRDIEIACNDGRLDDAGASSDLLNEHFDEALKGLRDYAAGM